MPDLIDMKKTDRDDDDMCCGPDKDSLSYKYGYGLAIYLDDEQLSKLGMEKSIEVGSVVNITAMGIVENSNESVSLDDGRKATMTVQITHLGIAPDGKKSADEILYPNMKGE